MIRTEGLSRWFSVHRQRVHAVRGVDLRVEPGELVALLGPNGAGKSTTLRMLTTLLPPSDGTAIVAGHDVRTARPGVRARIGYVGQRNGLGAEQRVRDELVSQGRAYGLTRARARRRADEVIEMLDLGELARRRPATLSGGQRRRVDIALGLVHQPSLLFLDEPSTGLDPTGRAEVWQHILRLREEHDMTLLLTTHYLEEADRIAGRVVIIDRGRVIADDTPSALKRRIGHDHVVIGTDTPDEAARVAERRWPEAPVRMAGQRVRVDVPDATAALPEYVRALAAAKVLVHSAEAVRPSLDDVFLALTGRNFQDDEVAA